MATGEGFIEVTADRVAVLTDLAVPADRIDEAKAEEARQRAEARLREKLSAEEVATVNGVQREQALREAGKLRTGGGQRGRP
jgi:F-type H+-transporting ATPase subunit epsilon